MQIYQMIPHYTLARNGDHDPLTQPGMFVEYMQGAFEDCVSEESLWLISMNPCDRPIARTLLRTGPLVAATSSRDLFRVALKADAHAIAVVRGEPCLNVAMTIHDVRALKQFGETAGWLNIQFVDYLVFSTTNDNLRKPLFHSWHANGRSAATGTRPVL